MDRVTIVGSGGSGKTTLAIELGMRTGLPVIHLDRIHWQPGWVETPTAQWEALVAREAEKTHWIMDGNYAGTYELRFRRSDTIVVLAISRWRCLFRALTRALRNRGRSVQAAGCPERLDLHFLRWIWQYPRVSRPRLDAAIAEAGHDADVVELRSTADVESFLARAQPR